MISKWRTLLYQGKPLIQVDLFFSNLLREVPNQQKEKLNATVIEALPDTTFKVQLEDGREVLAYLAGKMRMNYIKVMIGDRVAVELSPDGLRGRIVYRY